MKVKTYSERKTTGVRGLWNRFDAYMSEPNPEGVRGWDALFVPMFAIGVMVIAINLALFLVGPGLPIFERIFSVLFPFAG